jgi:DegV family protein with EDD domain
MLLLTLFWRIMPKIAFVTDSTAYLPVDLVKKFNITIVPQILIWGDQTYMDGIDIKPQEFYARLKTTKVMPTTSQVSVLSMQNTFQHLINEGNDVIGIFLSAKLSGTMQSANQGREALGASARKVTIIDSYTTAMAMGFQVLIAVRAANDGASLTECLTLVNRSRDHCGVYFAVDTLEFLHRGGRIGGAQRFIGSALNLKPILMLKDGYVAAEDRVRTKSKALDRLIELVTEKLKGKSSIRIATLHANAEKEARDLLSRASSKFNAVESILSSVSPVVGTHAGPGTVGLAFMEGM